MTDNRAAPAISDEDGRPGDFGGQASDTATHPRPGARFRWSTNLGYATLLVILALLPSTSSIVSLSPPDRLAHAMAYGVQAALLFWACLPTQRRNRALLVGVVGATTFGMLTEALQLIQPSRSVELADVAANSVGAILACGAIVGVARLADRRRE